MAVGYDIYKNNNLDPINLGEIAYFNREPTKQDFIEWIGRGIKREIGFG